MTWAMLLAAILAPIALPKIAPHKNNKKNLPAKVNAPSGPNGKYSSNVLDTVKSFVSAIISEQSKAATKTLNPRSAIQIKTAIATNNPIFPIIKTFFSIYESLNLEVYRCNVD